MIVDAMRWNIFMQKEELYDILYMPLFFNNSLLFFLHHLLTNAFET